MIKEVYSIKKNIEIAEPVDYLVLSNYSPLIKHLDSFVFIKNLVVIDNDSTWDDSFRADNVENIIHAVIDNNNSAVDYGVVRRFFSTSIIKREDFICIDSTNLVLPVYSYIYAYLKDIVKCKKIWFIYHEARTYKNPLEYSFHRGVIKTVQLECFLETEVKKRELLVYIIGFEGVLTETIDRMREPSKKIIINGFPSYLLSYKDASILNNTHLFSNSYSIDYCTASNPFQIYNKLQSIYMKYRDNYNITIAPCGSTPSSIGTIMFAASNDDVNVIIARPEYYEYDNEREYENRWIYCC